MVAITKPTVGGDTDTWGTKLNTALDTLATAVTTLETGGSGIPASTLTTKGDLLVATAAGTVVRQPVGANSYSLQADSTKTNGMWWALQSGCLVAKLRQTSNQSIPNSTYTNLNFQSADYDRTGSFSSGATSFTPGLAGWYELSGGLTLSSVNSSYRSTAWVVNGNFIYGSAASASNMAAAIPEALTAKTTIVQLSASDNVGLQVWQGTGSAMTTYSTAPHGAVMQIRWVGYP